MNASGGEYGVVDDAVRGTRIAAARCIFMQPPNI